MASRYELRQGSRTLNAVDDESDFEVELAVARERLRRDLDAADRAADGAEDGTSVSCDC